MAALRCAGALGLNGTTETERGGRRSGRKYAMLLLVIRRNGREGGGQPAFVLELRELAAASRVP